MAHRIANDGVQIVIDHLAQAEGRLLKLIERTSSDAMVAELGNVLRDLAVVREQVETPSPSDARGSARVHERAMIFIRRGDGRLVEAALHDISTGGALISCDMSLDRGESCSVDLPGLDQPVRATARPGEPGFAHLAFEALPPASAASLGKHLDRHFFAIEHPMADATACGQLPPIFLLP